MPTMREIPLPMAGFSERDAFGKQQDGTTRDCQNVVPIDNVNGRERLAQRPGLNKAITPDARLNGANKVADLAGITKDEDNLAYVDEGGGTPTNVFGKALPGARAGAAGSEFLGDCVDMRMDDFGCLFVAQRTSGVFKYNQAGTLLQEILLPDSESVGRIEIAAIDVDEFANLVVVTGGGGPTVAEMRLHFFQILLDGTYILRWTIDSGRVWMDVAFHKGSIYALESTVFAGTAAGTAFLTKYPDYNVVTAPVEDTTVQVDLTADIGFSNLFGTRMAIRDDGIVYVTGCDNPGAPTTVRTFVAKYNPGGDAPTANIWQADSTTDDLGGLGYGIAVGPRNSNGQNTVYTYGPQGTASTNTSEARRFVDVGSSVIFSGGVNDWDVSLVVPAANPATTKFCRIDTDADGHLYICPVTTSGNIVDILKNVDGTTLNGFDESTADSIKGGPAIAVTKEDKPKGAVAAGIEEVEFVFFGTREAVTDELAFFKQRMIDVDQTTNAPRTLTRLGVSGGTIVKFTDTAVSTPTGGSGALDSTSPYVMSASLGLLVYFTDGRSYKKYSVDDDEVTDWVSDTQGVIPPRCRLIDSWRGRIVIAGDPEDPQLWHMSKVGFPSNWDNFPGVPTVLQAISGVNAKAGKVPDIVNTIVPWDDDLCLFGGDKSIWRLTGDPLAGGQFHQVSLETGMAFGKPWTLDPVGGRLFFIGSRGSLYMMTRNSLPERISTTRIERQLQDNINFDTHYVRLAWDYRREGLLIVQCPFGAGGTSVKAWFWTPRLGLRDAYGSFWPELYGTSSATDVQPTSIYQYDADKATDRFLAFGGEDGRIRRFTEGQLSDEGPSADVAIQANIVGGPLISPAAPYESRFSHFIAVLARAKQGAALKLYAEDEPDVLNEPVYTAHLSAGRNNALPARVRAMNVFWELSNHTAGEAFGIESLQYGHAPAGRARVRL